MCIISRIENYDKLKYNLEYKNLTEDEFYEESFDYGNDVSGEYKYYKIKCSSPEDQLIKTLPSEYLEILHEVNKLWVCANAVTNDGEFKHPDMKLFHNIKQVYVKHGINAILPVTWESVIYLNLSYSKVSSISILE